MSSLREEIEKKRIENMKLSQQIEEYKIKTKTQLDSINNIFNPNI